jgi:1-acyl-sn-glycerol-3-phosphate acyltransferase
MPLERFQEKPAPTLIARDRSRPSENAAIMNLVMASGSKWEPPAPRDILHWPLPHQGLGNRLLIRTAALLARRQVVGLEGAEHILAERDPFILALSHSTRTETFLVPTLLFLRRGGRLIHFLADWNFRLIPGVGLIYRRAGAVTVMRKSARPRFLNLLKPLYRQPLPALEQARAHLLGGRSVGIYPEGTVNRDPRRLLAGRGGAARLSLETCAPIVPVGIRFPSAADGAPISDRATMEVRIGAPLRPPHRRPMRATPGEVRAWHAVVMREISRLSGKAWPGPAAPDAAAPDAPAGEIGNAP